MNSNNLYLESSPYLLQHAQNPVHWQAWSVEAFNLAKKENKLVLISIGYSACHWCHVMEKESFEDNKVAEYMNKHFINIKVDREERPDVDQIYMEAVQIMTGQGGWPLNCFALPDGRPVYGGTYFPKNKWLQIMNAITKTVEKEPQRIEEYAQKLSDGIIQNGIITITNEGLQFEESLLKKVISQWKSEFDPINGGLKRAPKFPLPNHLSFLMAIGVQKQDKSILDYVKLTLNKMAMGGIHDQIGGGFARYSVDEIWKVPHFEKMLYDNGQLLSLYSDAYKYFKEPYYKEVSVGIINWLKNEMLDSSGAFYSALDADSEGEEGKYYCWTEKELQLLLKEDWEWIKDYYCINDIGYWEGEKYILVKNKKDSEFIKHKSWAAKAFKNKKERVIELLNKERDKKIKPGLDNKMISSWNGIMLKGLCDAYSVNQENSILELALNNANWIIDNQIKKNRLIHCATKTKAIEGFLEDYAFVIDAFIALYQITFDEKWIEKAKRLCEKSMELFFDEKSKMLFFTSKETFLIARKIETYDSVMPSSNSVMATNLYILGHYYRNNAWISNAEQMTKNMSSNMHKYATGFSNWANLMMHVIYGLEEISIIGKDSKKYLDSFIKEYYPNQIICGGLKPNLPIANYKGKKEKTLLYKCHKGTCQSPIELK